MLEILALYYLSRKNKTNALARGRKPGFFMAMTFILWFGMEILGLFLGAYLGGQVGAYLMALTFAVIGGVISYILAKNCKPGGYELPADKLAKAVEQYAQPLAAPSGIRIVREGSFAGAAVRWTFTLNGQLLGNLSNDSAMDTYTNQRQNILRAADSYGNEIAPFVFDVGDNGYAEVHFKANRFLPERSVGIYPPTMPQQPAATPPMAGGGYASGPQPPYAADAQPPAVCRQCGAALTSGAVFCSKCGARL